MKKQVEGRSSKQAPANRTVWFEHVMFHITGNDSSYDFDDVEKAITNIKSGREVTAYYYREGFTLHRGSEVVTPRDTTYHIATVKRGCKNFDKLIKRINNALKNNGKDGVSIFF